MASRRRRVLSRFSLACLALTIACSDQDTDSGTNALGSSGGFAGSFQSAGGSFAAGGLSGNAGLTAAGGAAGAGVIGSGGMVTVGAGGQPPNAGGLPGVGGSTAGGPSGGEAGSIAGAGGVNGGAAGVGGEGQAAGAGGQPAGDSPCPAAGEPCKILPLGDSITYGLGDSDGGGYRLELFRLALEANKNITFVGRVMNGPRTVDGRDFPRNNEGHSGWTISQIDGIVPSPALNDDPHIILLMIGTNDMYRSPSGGPDRLATLLDQLIEAAPDALIVVAQLTPLGFSNAAVETYNAALPDVVDELAQQGHHVKLVDMYTGFSTSMLADGVHPNQLGYEHMADVWWEAIEDVLR